VGATHGGALHSPLRWQRVLGDHGHDDVAEEDCDRRPPTSKSFSVYLLHVVAHGLRQLASVVGKQVQVSQAAAINSLRMSVLISFIYNLGLTIKPIRGPPLGVYACPHNIRPTTLPTRESRSASLLSQRWCSMSNRPSFGEGARSEHHLRSSSSRHFLSHPPSLFFPTVLMNTAKSATLTIFCINVRVRGH
jgi:hypothetical protein